MMKILLPVIILLVFFCPPALADTVDKEEVHNLFYEAKTFFNNANNTKDQDLYKKAVMRYERIVKEGGIVNGKLYYNIGNTYFLMDDLGSAILNYRRAEKFIPFDENLRQNLDFAISKRKDKIEEKQKTRALKTVLFWHYDFSFTTRLYIFAAASILFWIGMSLRLFSHNLYPRWALFVTAFFAVIFFVSLIGVMPGQNNKQGVIIEKEVIARKGNGKNYAKSFSDPLHAGTDFTLIEERGDWFMIELTDGRTCWIQTKDVGLL